MVKKCTLKASRVFSVLREDARPISAAKFHATTKKWLGDNQPFVMDVDPGVEVWNQAFDLAKIEKSRELPASLQCSQLMGSNGGYAGGKLAFYKTTLSQNNRKKMPYHYWLEKDKKDNRVLNSGWLTTGGFKPPPCMMWRIKPGTRSLKRSGVNRRNPFVAPDLVDAIHQKSL